MTVRLPGTPSVSHERRRVELGTLAALLGFAFPVVPPLGVIPDVVLTHVDDGSLFVGEAKHTESPTDRSSAARLLVYLDWLRRSMAGPQALVGLACPPRQADAWAGLLTALTADARLVVDSSWVRSLSATTAVVLLAVRPTPASRM